MAAVSSGVFTSALSPRAPSFSSAPLTSTCTTKSSPQRSLTPRMISQAMRVRFSMEAGP